MTGTITAVYVRKGYGFITLANGGRDLFFHETDLTDDLEFDEQLTELRVRFEQTSGRKGDRAADVRPADVRCVPLPRTRCPKPATRVPRERACAGREAPTR